MSNAEYLALLDEQDRRLAQRSFLAYYMRMTGFRPPKHIKIMCRLLQALEDDKVDRAMLFLPPRCAKTTVGSHLFPSWIMGRHPTSPIMSVAHTERYAKKIGARVRQYIRSPEWPWPEVCISSESSAKEAFAVSAGGEYNGFGMFGGNQHGNAAEWLFMDDIIKGRKLALSPHMREEAWETYKTDLDSRLQGRCKQLLIMTRWHPDDPPGRILPADYDGRTGWYRDRETGEPWYVLSLPAVAEHENDPMGRAAGEWVWPGRVDETTRGGTRRRGGWIWSALYQQRPSPEEGLMFRAEHIQRYDPLSIDLSRMQIYMASDYAVTAEAGASDPDYTVHEVWGVDDDWNIHLLDGWRGRTEPDRWAQEWIRLAKKWKPLRAGEEAGQIIRSVGPFLKRMMHDERVFVDRVQLTSTANKEQRAQSLLGMAAMGKLFLPHRTKVQGDMLALLDAMEAELLQFPAGKHDDTVDAATLFARMLDRIVAGQRPSAISAHGNTMDALWSQHDEALERMRSST
jgi:predicted phage terminase large subunit-like protein